MFCTVQTRISKVQTYTQRGRSRAQHVRDREADIEKREKLAPGAFAMLERPGPHGRAHIWDVFSCKGGERANGEARRTEPMLWLF